MSQPAMMKPRAAPPPPPPAGNRPKPPVENYAAARQVTSGAPHAPDCPGFRCGNPPVTVLLLCCCSAGAEAPKGLISGGTGAGGPAEALQHRVPAGTNLFSALV